MRKQVTLPTSIDLRCEALDEMTSFLGSPSLLRFVGEPSSAAVVSRWQYETASIDVSPSQYLRIAVNLLGGCRSLVDGQMQITQRVCVGNVAILPPGSHTKIRVPGPGDVLQFFIPFDGTAARQEPYSRGLISNLNRAGIQALAFQVLLASTRDEPGDGLLIEENIAKIRALALGIVGDDSSGSRRGPKACALSPYTRTRLENLVDTEISQDNPDMAPLSLERMASIADLSVNHFIRSFHQDVGETPYQYVLRRRMDRAVDLLKCTQRTVAEIADATGFSTPAHFIARFRQSLGVTPGALRRALSL